ncbi:hypothetical protein HK107_12310 [Parvularcula sp. ZS-1/3]|uniref:GspL periplasmic domain-containing protein n=1 Tax=Parvularcula mediterranea TaxID=2732508 RepID=A0A7Y3W5T9_9PROT|nr:type II secretion system protein GspL [Parvularcula mediterranea]NNU17105.1 hypothetical protein [Parvularcula mediterranea]
MSFIILLDPHDSAKTFAWFDRVAGEEGGSAALTSLAERIASQSKTSVCLALPGEAAMTRSLPLAMKSQRDVRRAASLAFDDQLAAPMDDRLLAFADEGEGRKLVSAIPADLLRDGLAAAEAAGIEPDVITVDHALLPSNENGSSILALGDRAAVRTPEGAFTSEADFASGLAAEARPVSLADLSVDGAPNFREGRFARRRQLPNLRPYLMAASLLLVAGAVFLLGSFLEGVRYSRAATVERQAAEQNFARAFPGTPILDMERQIRSRENSRQGSDFLPLSAILADALATQESTALSSLTYSSEGELTAELTFASFPDLEALKGILEARGVAAEEGSETRSEDGVLTTRLFLRSAA